MSLLKAIEEAKALVSSLEALLGTEVVNEVVTEPWYLNIPKEGVECWVDDREADVKKERDGEYDDEGTRIVYSYDSSRRLQFITDGFAWKYAIPVDPNLRLPNGEITL